MQLKFKTAWSLAATSLVALTGLVHAVDDMQFRNLENRVSSLEQKKGSNGMVNPPARPLVRDGADLFVTGDLLYWQANENGLDVAIKNENGTTFINDGKMKNLHNDWSFGFKVGVGYNMMHDGWDIYANWTRFYTHGHRHVTAPAGGTVFPIWLNAERLPVGNATVSDVHAHWRLHLNVIDFELGREFFTSKWLTLRPHFGLRTNWVNQKFKVSHEGGTTVAAGSQLNDRLLSRFWGLGLRAGLNTQWGLGGGWSFFGNGAAALLWGHFHLDSREKLQPANTGQLDLDHHMAMTVAETDLFGGLRWDTNVSDESFHFGFLVGWEQHMFFDQNQFLRFVDDLHDGSYVSNLGNLSTHGWTAEIQLDF